MGATFPTGEQRYDLFMPKLRCWIIACKTGGCGEVLFLDRIGPADKFAHTLLPPVARFIVTCPTCTNSHDYGHSDVKEADLENPPNGRCSTFVEAMRKASAPSDARLSQFVFG